MTARRVCKGARPRSIRVSKIVRTPCPREESHQTILPSLRAPVHRVRDSANSAAQTVRLQHGAGLDRGAGTRVLLMKEDGKLRPDRRALPRRGLLEQVVLNVLRQTAPKLDHRLAQRT